jgi:hypothetical protein
MGEISVLDRRLREKGGIVRGEGLVKGQELLDEYPGRPAIESDVMYHHQQQVLLRTQARQASPQQRPLDQIERTLSFFPCQPCGLGVPLILRKLTEIYHTQVNGLWRCNKLNRSPLRRGKGRAQDFVPPKDLTQALHQCPLVE